MTSPTTPEAPRPMSADEELSHLAALVNDIRRRDRTSYIWMPEEASTIRRTDIEPGFEDDADYRRWADRASGALIIEKGLVDLEDALSVLALMHRLRHMAETDDRRYFALNPEATLRQRLACPGEGWELMRHAEDRPGHCLVPAALVTRSQAGNYRRLFLHPEAFEIGRTRRHGSARRLPHAELENAVDKPRDNGFGRVFDWVDFSQMGPGHANYLRFALMAFGAYDDEDWFAAHPGAPVRERFVCPGELDLQNGGMDEYVEVRRLNGLLWRVAMHDGQSPHGVGYAMTDSLVPERYAPSRIYPCHGLR